VLAEQDRQHAVWRDQAQEPALGVDDREARLSAGHHRPRRALLIGRRTDHRRIPVHEIGDDDPRRGLEQSLDRNEADQPIAIQHDEVRR
jgi:hypothetical protein